MATHYQTKEEALKTRKWLLVDATDIPLGRLASEVAALIRGKHKVAFTKHVDGGDFVVVLNAEKLRLTGNKAETKLYRHHTTYIGGLKTVKAGTMLQKNPVRMIELAVKGMLPKGNLGRGLGSKLKVYRNAEHPHAAQNPQVYKLKYVSAQKA